MADAPVWAEAEGPLGSPEYFTRACPPSTRSEAIWAETARRLGVSDV
ncbi:hypothetical protein [Microbacterium sp.]